MEYSIIVEQTFEKEVKRLYKKYPSLKQDIYTFAKKLVKDPLIGADLGGGLRKIRMPIGSKGKGKSGGARVISFNIKIDNEKGVVHLIYLYDKSERESISKKEIEELLNKTSVKQNERSYRGFRK